jgi:hypothetical protein
MVQSPQEVSASQSWPSPRLLPKTALAPMQTPVASVGAAAPDSVLLIGAALFHHTSVQLLAMTVIR